MDLDNQKLTAIISTIRHGEKDENGALTEAGRMQATKAAAIISHLEGDVVLLHSSVDRVKDTIIHTAKSLNPEGSFASYTSHYLHYLFDPSNKGEFFTRWDDVNGNSEKEFERMKNFLAMENISTEPHIYPSPKEMAIRLGRVIITEIDFATITVPEIRTNYINGSHEPVIMAFIYYLLQDFEPKDNNFMEGIGRSVDFTEGFEIYVYQDLSGENKVIFKFRNIEKEIDQNRLRMFCMNS